jgi:HPt (histidine-containing phosphotransfer) domain-containing protein
VTDRSLSSTVGIGGPGQGADLDEALSTRLRDLALVDIDALILGDRAQELVAAFADDVLDALREARTRIAALRSQLGGADPLAVLDAATHQRASDAGAAGVDRIRGRLAAQAEAARALARLADLAAGLIAKLFEADRRR